MRRAERAHSQPLENHHRKGVELIERQAEQRILKRDINGSAPFADTHVPDRTLGQRPEFMVVFHAQKSQVGLVEIVPDPVERRDQQSRPPQ